MPSPLINSLKITGILIIALFLGWTHQGTAQSKQTAAPATPAVKTSGTAATHTLHHKKSRAKAKAKAEEKPAAQAESKPVEPPKPDWPVNDPPKNPYISWDSKGLRIEANNSSLETILKGITAQTGVTVEGLDKDQRIFGVYGPGRARDVLAQLLDGTGYNVLMVGEQAPGTPRQIVLSAKSDAPAGTTDNKTDNRYPRVAPAIEEDEEVPELVAPVQVNQPPNDDQQNQQNQQNQQPMRPGFQNPQRPGMPGQPGQPLQQSPQ